ncbi:D-2-hydroxyacid dehydrogenase [Jeongeupia naejangsanensis]|uniref:D-2-hydroxyacid dehydrogenase n=2 Tax=Jeongeupia naejangsanensis TaxID=613195 RepID=A0ABS2BIA3_9NEIS|nr:D-2-hydroxyacid dehydrogenase [Jeongeupia naejangsanensis]MBM3115322.1 D-2-hydroxyacid dehydrogenase [Jeongeupia naejangsanensis]
MMSPEIVFLDRETLPATVRRPEAPHRWVEYAQSGVEEARERLRTATVAISNKVPLTAELIYGAPELKCIAVAATGYNIVDLAACRDRGIVVSNIRDYATAGVPEHALMLMLALKRQLLSYRRDLAGGAWQRAPGFCHFGAPLHDLAGGTLTIVGSGALGQALGKLARALGMHVIFAEKKEATSLRPGYVPFDQAITQADVISLHCPLNERTRNMIAARELGLMKPDAVLINTARGGLIDEAALLDALKAGRIGGAGLDVLIEEPPRNDNPLLDVDLPNLIITPHIAWAGAETMQRLADQLIDNVDAFLRGEPRNVVS